MSAVFRPAASQHKKDMEQLEWVQRRFMSMCRVLKHLLYEIRLRQTMFCLDKRTLWGDLTLILKYFKGTYKLRQSILQTDSDRTRRSVFNHRKEI